MKKFLSIIFVGLLLTSMGIYADTVYTVKSGDSIWKIAVNHEVGVSELINANPHIKNINLIYPENKITIPQNNFNTLALETEVVNLVNQERASLGISPLSQNWELSRVARFKSEDMRDKKYFSHQSPTYGSPFDMIRNFGIKYNTAGENIAMGYISAKAVVNGWMNSPGHRSNILNKNYKYIGVGYCSNNYWTQMFIG